MIIVECYAEDELARALGFSDVEHKENKAAIIRELERRAGAGARLVGMIDEDPGSAWPKCWRSFSLIRASKHGFSVWAGPGGAYAVVLQPRHEEWAYRAARACGLDPRNYGLPRDPEDFWELLHRGRKLRLRTLACYRKMLADMLHMKCPALLELKEELRALLGGGT